MGDSISRMGGPDPGGLFDKDELDLSVKLLAEINNEVINVTKTLKENRDLQSHINKQLTKGGEEAEKAKAVQTQLTELSKGNVKSVTELKSLEKTLTELKKEGVSGLEDQLLLIDGLIGKMESVPAIFRESADMADDLSDKMFGWINGLPGGDALAAGIGLDNFTKQFENVAKTEMASMLKGGNLADGFTAIGNAGKQAFVDIGKALAANPMMALVLFLAAAVKRFFEMDKAASDFRKETGLLKSQTADIDKEVRNVSTNFAHLGVEIEDAYKAAGALSATFGKGAAGVAANIEFVAVMNKNLGVSEETSAKTMQNIMGMSDATAESAQATMMFASQLAEAAGVAPKAVMEDIANASEKTKIMMRGNVDQMMRLAVESRRVGISIESVAGAARGHLDFQSSINAEMELSTLIGKNINLQKMRQLAFEGDLEGMLKEQQKQLKNVGDITKMNAFQQEAVAKAFGMSVDELVNMQAKEKMNAQFKKEVGAEEWKRIQDKKKAAEAELSNMRNLETELKKRKELGMDTSKIESQISAIREKQFKQMSKEQQMQGQSEKLMNSFKAILTTIGAVLEPIITVLSNVLVPIFTLIAGLVRALFKPFVMITTELTKGGTEARGFEKILYGVVDVVDFIGTSIGWVLVVLTKISFVGVVILEAFMKIGNVAKLFGLQMQTVGGWLKDISDAFDKWGEKLIKIANNGEDFATISVKIAKKVENINKFFKSLINNSKILSFIFKGISSIFTKISSVVKLILTGIKPIKGVATIMSKVGSIASGIVNVFIKITKVAAGILGPVLKIFAGLAKFLGPIGWIITAFEAITILVKDLFSIWGDGTSSFGDKIIKSLVAIPSAILYALWSPFEMILDWIGGFFGKEIGSNITSIFGELGDSIVGQISNTFSTIFNIIKFPFVTIYDLITSLFTGDTGVFGRIFESVKTIFSGIFDIIVWPFKTALDLIGGIFGFNSLGTTIIDGIKSIVSTIFDILTWPYRKMLEYVGSIGSLLFDLIMFPFKSAFDLITSLFTGDIGVFGRIFESMKSIFSKIFDIMVWPFKTVWDFIGNLFGIGSLGTILIDSFVNIFVTIKNKIVGFFTGIFDNISNFFSWENIASKLKPILSKIPDMFLPESLEKVKYMAEGGIVTQPVNAVVGEAGPEAVIPLDQYETGLDASGIEERLDTTNQLLMEFITLMKSGGVSINMDGKKVASTVAASQKYA